MPNLIELSKLANMKNSNKKFTRNTDIMNPFAKCVKFIEPFHGTIVSLFFTAVFRIMYNKLSPQSYNMYSDFREFKCLGGYS